MHRVYMRFAHRGDSWHCEFIQDGVKLLRTFTFATADKVAELAKRGGALKTLEDKQMLESGIMSKSGGVMLKLTPVQYEILKKAG
jgi:hypothetical protein